MTGTGLETYLNEDSVYWVVGAVGLILFFILTLVFFRTPRPPKEGLERTNTGLSGAAAPESVVTAAPDVDEALSEGPARARIPANETLVAESLAESGAPLSDVPLDLSALPLGGLKEDLSVRPHAAAEIPRQEAKPLSTALSNTRNSFFGRIKSLFGSKPTLEASELEELEEILYTSDLGPQTVQRLLEAVEERVKGNTGGFEAVRSALKAEMLEIFDGVKANGQVGGSGNGQGRRLHAETQLSLVGDSQLKEVVHHGSEEYLEGLENLSIWNHKPAVMMIVGVNGAGKTTTIGKLARRIAQSGRRVLVAAGDTFRAAAGDQLKVWTERAQVEIFSPEDVTDPSAVAFMAVEKAQSQGFDVVIVDTAGRLHTQKNLMEELKKMKRVMSKKIETAPHEVLLVLDANSGQNALIQAKEFNQAIDVTGVVLTKLDGSAKGGVAVGLAYELKIPIKLIGVGEGIEDLRRFSSKEFVDSII